MVTGKINELINESHKYFTNVSFHISTIRGIEPNNLPLASLTLEWTKEHGKQNIGLYRDDGLSFFKNISGPDSEKIKKKLFKIFKSNGLSITVECNLIVTDFLDVTFDLKSATYYPYRKPNNVLYIKKHSNHPPSIINEIPSIISNRISQNSCDKNHLR